MVAAIDAVVGEAVGAVTVIAAVPVEVTPAVVSAPVMVAEPGAIPVTSPVALTMATVAALVVKVKPVVTPAMVAPFASRAAAVNALVAPIPIDGAAAVRPRLAKTCATVRLTLADAAPLVAVMVAEPLPVEVTVAELPEPTTVSTAGLLDAQVTDAFGNVAKLASFTTAVTVRVSPIDAIDAVLDGVRTIDAATATAVPLSLPHPLARSAVTAIIVVTMVLRNPWRMCIPLVLVSLSSRANRVVHRPVQRRHISFPTRTQGVRAPATRRRCNSIPPWRRADAPLYSTIHPLAFLVVPTIASMMFSPCTTSALVGVNRALRCLSHCRSPWLRRLSLVASVGLALARDGIALRAQLPPTSSSATRDDMLGSGVSASLAAQRRGSLRNVRYNLHLDVGRGDTATGRVTVTFTRTQTADAILDFRGLALASARVNAVSLDVRDSALWNGAHIRIPAKHLRAGANRLEFAFAVPVASAGASIIRTRDVTDGAEYLYTLLVPSDANLLFPCFDQPDLKARITFSVTTPLTWRALANGRPTHVDSTSSTLTHHFAETAPLSTYLIAFAAGPWRTVTRALPIVAGAAPTQISAWSRASRASEMEADTLLAMNARALRWLGDWFGVPYPFGKFDFLLAPAFPFGGMEHPGAIFYNEESFIYRERPTLSQLLGRQATTFHEVAHQWFGDYVTMRWFDDLWLKEGFATYMAAKMQASLEPTSNAWKTFYLRNKPVAYATDATAGTTPVWQSLANLDQAKSNYGPIVYNKAPGVLRQLEYLVGEVAFQKGIRAFLREHAYANATWRDLLRAIGTSSGRNLGTWGAQWIVRPGMPVVEQQVTVRSGRIARLTLLQRPAQRSVSGPGAWPLKLQLLLHYADGRPALRLPVEFASDSVIVTAATGLAAPDFVFANDGDFGYALVLPDTVSVRWLEGHVGTIRDDFARAMLWGALWDLVREARLAPERFAAIALRELPRESDEQLSGSLVNRLATALSRYATPIARDSLLPRVERTLFAGATDSTKPYGQRKSQLDALINLAQDEGSLRRLDAWLDSATALGLPLRPPTRWSIVTRLIARGAPSAEARLAAETRRDSTSEGRRLAFVAGAARPSLESKQQYFSRWFSDRDLNEEWVTSSLRAFNDPERQDLTRGFLRPALDTLPWIQRHRRIFFLSSWLGAAIGGQSEPAALTEIDEWLVAHPRLAPDLRQKILQSRDELERTVAIRRAFGAKAM